MPGRRGFLKALAVSTAGAALTVTQPPVSTSVIVREKLIWPDFLPPMVARPETDEAEARRLIQMLLDAERELFSIPHTQDVIWNGFTFRLNAGANIVPAPIAYVYRLAERDKAEGEATLRQKYSHTYRGGSV